MVKTRKRIFGSGEISEKVERYLIFALPFSSGISESLQNHYEPKYAISTINFWLLVLAFLLSSYFSLMQWSQFSRLLTSPSDTYSRVRSNPQNGSDIGELTFDDVAALGNTLGLDDESIRQRQLQTRDFGGQL